MGRAYVPVRAPRGPSRSCKSWYVDAHGRNITLWPHETWRFRNDLLKLKPAEYRLLAPAGDGAAPSEPARELAVA